MTDAEDGTGEPVAPQDVSPSEVKPTEDATPPAPPAAALHPALALSYLFLGGVLLFAIWRALPARWLPVDLIGTGIALAALAAGVLVWRGHPHGLRVALVVSGVWLIIGAAVTTTLAWTASSIVGLYGPVGSGGALVLVFVALRVLPYMVGAPALQALYCLRRRT